MKVHHVQMQKDGSISQWVEVSGDVVNLNMIGSYDINYNCYDSDGNQAVTKSRTVIVDQGVGDANGDGVMNVLEMVVFVEIIINDF